MTTHPKKPTHSLNRLYPAVMLKGIPSVAWTSRAHPLEFEGKRTWNENGP